MAKKEDLNAVEEVNETTEDVLKDPKKEKVKKKEKEKEAEEPKGELTEHGKLEARRIELRILSAFERFAMLKYQLRSIALEKEEAGYNSTYFYIGLQDMQDVFTKLEYEFSLTSIFTEVTKAVGSEGNQVIKNIARRVCYDVVTNQEVSRTEIDITNLKQLIDVYGIEKDVLRISQPKDAINTLLFDFFEPQNVGSISTYMQRYTYNQLYDFQETKADKIEQKGRLRDKGETVIDEEKETKKKTTKTDKNKKDTAKSPKEDRLSDDALEIRSKVKSDFDRADIIEALDGRKLKEMNKPTATEFYAFMNENYTKKGEI